MEPSYTGVNHSPSLALPLMEDIGWGIQPLTGTDIVFIIDVTGSTGALLPGWVAQIPTLAQAWKNYDPNARFALVSHVDFPFSPYGVAGEWAYRVETTFDPTIANLQAALALLTQQYGADSPESQYCAIHQVLTGSGIDLTPPIQLHRPGRGAAGTARPALPDGDLPLHLARAVPRSGHRAQLSAPRIHPGRRSNHGAERARAPIGDEHVLRAHVHHRTRIRGARSAVR